MSRLTASGVPMVPAMAIRKTGTAKRPSGTRISAARSYTAQLSCVSKKLLCNVDGSRFFASVEQPNAHRAHGQPTQPIGPLDGEHTRRRKVWIQTDLVQVCPIQPVEIDMDQRESAAAV